MTTTTAATAADLRLLHLGDAVQGLTFAQPRLDRPPSPTMPPESLESSCESRRCDSGLTVASTILCARFFRFSESSSDASELLQDAVRDLLLNLVRRCTLLPVLAAAPLAVPLPAGWLCWRAATNWLRMTGRGVVLVLSELPTSVPSSKISFRQLVVEVRIAFDRVGDGIVLYFGIVDAVTMLSVGIGIVIVELSVMILVVTSSPPPPPPAMLRMH
uniref:Uncharacterized protein n=1 Tax=Anopheles merus TaxID=30066 RepID=A0A182VF98_ANOME